MRPKQKGQFGDYFNGIIKASLKRLMKRYIFSNYYLLGLLFIEIDNKTMPLLINCIPVVIVILQSIKIFFDVNHF